MHPITGKIIYDFVINIYLMLFWMEFNLFYIRNITETISLFNSCIAQLKLILRHVQFKRCEWVWFRAPKIIITMKWILMWFRYIQIQVITTSLVLCLYKVSILCVGECKNWCKQANGIVRLNRFIWPSSFK